MVPRPSTTSSKVGPNLLLSRLGTTSSNIEVLVHSLLGPIKSVKQPRDSSPVEADRLSKLWSEPRTVPIFLIRHLIHPVAVVEHVVQHHGMNRCMGTWMAASFSLHKLRLRRGMLCLWLRLRACFLLSSQLLHALQVVFQKGLHVSISKRLHHLGLYVFHIELTVCFLTKLVDQTHVKDGLLVTCSKISNVVGNQLTNINRATIHDSGDSVHSHQRNLR